MLSKFPRSAASAIILDRFLLAPGRGHGPGEQGGEVRHVGFAVLARRQASMARSAFLASSLSVTPGILAVSSRGCVARRWQATSGGSARSRPGQGAEQGARFLGETAGAVSIQIRFHERPAPCSPGKLPERLFGHLVRSGQAADAPDPSGSPATLVSVSWIIARTSGICDPSG